MNHVADAERGDGREDGKQDSCPACVEAFFQHIHWPARHLTAIVGDTVFHREQGLRILGGDTKNARKPHPKHRARPTHKHRPRHAVDVPRSNRRRQRSDQRAKLANVPQRARILCHGQLDGMPEMSLHKSRADSQEKVCAKEKSDEPWPPDQ